MRFLDLQAAGLEDRYKSREFSVYQSLHDLPIVYYRWRSTSDPLAVVQVAHGLGDHAFRYSRLAAVLTAARFRV